MRFLRAFDFISFFLHRLVLRHLDRLLPCFLLGWIVGNLDSGWHFVDGFDNPGSFGMTAGCFAIDCLGADSNCRCCPDCKHFRLCRNTHLVFLHQPLLPGLQVVGMPMEFGHSGFGFCHWLTRRVECLAFVLSLAWWKQSCLDLLAAHPG